VTRVTRVTRVTKVTKVRQMKRGVFKILLVSVIAIMLVLILFRARSPFGKSNTSFASEPENEITRIEFSQGKQILLLEKRGENWILNGKKETRKSGILFIIRVLKELRIKSPVSSEMFDKEVIAKGINPVHVRVYEKKKLIKTFLVYKTRSNIYGNIMKMRSGAKPFIVNVPGNESDIGSAFSMNELFWQPYTVFNLLPSEIESVDFENLSDTASSFSITNKNHRYFLTGRNRNLSGWDSSLVSRYLSYFTWIPFESWALDMDEADIKKVEATSPLYRIKVNTVAGKQTILTLWERMKSGDNSKITDSDRLIGKTMDRNEFFIIRYFDVDPILKKRLYFFPR
jgi:hypothetical protein